MSERQEQGDESVASREVRLSPVANSSICLIWAARIGREIPRTKREGCPSLLRQILREQNETGLRLARRIEHCAVGLSPSAAKRWLSGEQGRQI
jgi:hypothetical protein